MTTVKRTFWTVLAAATLSSTLVTTCSAALGVVLKPTDPDYPKTNAHPTHLIRLSGTISPTLHLALAAQYQTDRNPQCERSPNPVSEFIEGAYFPAVVNVLLTVQFNKDTFQATAVEDQFLPGRCNWHLHGVSAQLSKNGVTSLAGAILVTPDDDRNFDPKLIEWASSGAVIWRCRFSWLSRLPKGQYATACRYQDQDRLHGDRPYAILRPSTTAVEASFIDLEESAPAGSVGTGSGPDSMSH